MYCQVVYICGLIPARIRPALAELPDTLDETYKRTLREINKAEWEIAHRLFQFVAVAGRPLRVEELAELLAFDFEAGSIPNFHEGWRLEDPIHAVLSTCPSFLAIVETHDKFVQFSHFSVKEFLTSARLAEAKDIIVRRYHISETPAHTLAARACLGYILHIDMDAAPDGPPLTGYSVQYCIHHALLGGVSQNVKYGLKELLDPSKPHLAVFNSFSDDPLGLRSCELSARGTLLHYAANFGLHSIIELVFNEHSQDVNAQDFTNFETPLHVASRYGHLEFARILIERGAGVATQNKAGQTPLHVVSLNGGWHPCFGHQRFDTNPPQVARMLIERGADVSVQDKEGHTPLHLMSQYGQPEIAHILIESGADVSAQDEEGRTPMHLAPQAGLVVIRMLIEHGTDVSAEDKDGRTPLHLASQAGQLEVARILVESGADVSAQDKEGQTPLHLASQTSSWGAVALIRMLIERGADVSAQDDGGRTSLHLASQAGLLQVARMLVESGADVSAQDKEGRTPMHLASQAGQMLVIRMLIECGADGN